MKGGLVLSLLLLVPISLEAQTFFLRARGLDKADFYFLTPDRCQSLLFASSGSALYRSHDAGSSWEKIYVFQKGDINFILRKGPKLFVAAGDSLFLGTNEGENLRVLYSLNDSSQKILCMHSCGEKLYLGTTQGLFILDLSSKDATRVTDLPQNSEVWWISGQNPLLISSNYGIYRKKDTSWKRVYVVRKTDAEDLSSLNEKETSLLRVKVIKADINNPCIVYAGTTKGLLVSQDRGISWRKLFLEGVDNLEINYINQHPQNPNIVFISTAHGFFRANLITMKSQKMYKGLESEDVRLFSWDSQGKLVLATSKGIFKEGQENLGLENYVFGDGPSIKEVFRAAIRYNEIGPEKISRWRKQARLKAFLPTVKLDYDKTVTTALGASYDRVQVGPRDWGISFSWEVADLLWGTDQTSIDTRSRLNTQLRIDILEDVNRIYFERKRLVSELNNPQVTPQQKQEKILRIEELTAALDYYTGGYFSRRLEEISGGTSQ